MNKLILFFASLLISSFALYPYQEKDHIINLGDPSWGLANTDFPNGLFVYFYEPYCNPCRQMWPELVEAATNLATQGSKVKIGKIECHDEVNLCNARKVTAFPTLILYMKDKPEQEYRGSRDAQSIQKWISKVVDSSYEVVNDENTLFSKYSAAILLTQQDTWNINQAYQSDPYTVDIARAGNALQSKMNGSPAVLVTQRGEIVTLSTSDPVQTTKQKIADALYTQRIAVPNFSWNMKTKLEGNENIDYVIFFRTKKFTVGDASKAFDQLYKELGNTVFQFAYLNVVDDMLGHTIGKLFGVGADDDSAVGIISRKNKFNQKYKLTQEITTDNLQTFIKSFKSGSAERYYMTAEVPTEGPRGSVRELVSKNYNQVTSDPNLNVFVQFYFPWSEASIKLEPAWNALAYRFRDAKNVVIAKVNIDENDIQGVDLIDFPTLLFYGEGSNKKEIKYDSHPNIKSLQNFLFTHAPNLRQEIEL